METGVGIIITNTSLVCDLTRNVKTAKHAIVKAAYYKKILNHELSKRIEKNPRYSLRALAKAIGTDAGSLSRVLAGTKVPTISLSQKIFTALNFSPYEQHQFLNSVAVAYQQMGYQRLSPKIRALSAAVDPSGSQFKELSLDAFRIISDWYHYAILELTLASEFKSEAAWISKQLGISVTETKLAIERLLSLELLRVENGKYI